MKGKNLGELEELTMLAVAILFDDAYGVAIQKEIKKRTNRSLSISTVHSVLNRMEQKGYISSRYDGATPQRGGRRKHLFRLTTVGQRVLTESHEIRNSMWEAIPKLAFNLS